MPLQGWPNPAGKVSASATTRNAGRASAARLGGPIAVSDGAIRAGESFLLTGLIGKDLALWEEGQEALMSQGGPSVRQVGVSGSSSSVRARSPTHDAYVSMDPGGTVVFELGSCPAYAGTDEVAHGSND